MSRLKVIILLSTIFLTRSLCAQVDTVTFRIERDVSTFKVNCFAQKVEITGTDTTIRDFNIETTPTDTNYTFTWSGDGIVLTNGLPNATYSFSASGNYTISLDVTHEPSGKVYEETKTVDIIDDIIIPNVFTPGYDGRNDLFIVKANGIIPLEISIYSRSGTLVHQSEAPIIVWDGRNSSGSFVSKGIYFYILNSADPAVKTRKGFIHVYYDDEDIK